MDFFSFIFMKETGLRMMCAFLSSLGSVCESRSFAAVVIFIAPRDAFFEADGLVAERVNLSLMALRAPDKNNECERAFIWPRAAAACKHPAGKSMHRAVVNLVMPEKPSPVGVDSFYVYFAR